MSDLPLSPADAAFRDELRGWLAAHLVDGFCGQSGRGGPDDDDAWELRRDWERELGRGGWLGLGWPRALGGRAATPAQEVVFAMECASAGTPPRAAFHGETLLAPTLLAHGTDEQRARLLPPMARGEVVWCQGYSEPGAGSDLAGIATRAEPDGDGWRLTGQKVWTTFAHRADAMFALVRTDPGSRRHAGLSYVVLALDQPGVTVVPIRTMLGDSGFNEVFLDGARVAGRDVVGGPGNGWRVAMSTLGHERATSVLGYQFAFRRELAVLLGLARERGCAGDPLVRRRLAHVAVGLDVLRATTLRTLSGVLRRGEFGPEASIGKLLWSRWHQEFTELAVEVLGPDGLRGTEWGDGPDPAAELLRRAFVRARAETIYAGTSEIQLDIVAERVLGLPRAPRSVPA